MTFIGGTNLRLVKGIDRFSEDLDFDCKNLGGEEFGGMSDDVLVFLLNRGKGRDYYDVMFLLAQTPPDYRFLSARCGIHDVPELKAAVEASLQSVDLAQKRKDFEHLLFHRDNSRRILHFRDFIQSLP